MKHPVEGFQALGLVIDRQGIEDEVNVLENNVDHAQGGRQLLSPLINILATRGQEEEGPRLPFLSERGQRKNRFNFYSAGGCQVQECPRYNRALKYHQWTRIGVQWVRRKW